MQHSGLRPVDGTADAAAAAKARLAPPPPLSSTATLLGDDTDCELATPAASSASSPASPEPALPWVVQTDRGFTQFTTSDIAAPAALSAALPVPVPQRKASLAQVPTSTAASGLRAALPELRGAAKPPTAAAPGISMAVLKGPSPRPFEAEFAFDREIGVGGHSTVRLAVHKTTGRTVVAKFIRNSSVWHWHVDAATRVRVPLEVHLMQQITRLFPDNPFFASYVDHFDTAGTPRPLVIGGGLAASLTPAEAQYEAQLAADAAAARAGPTGVASAGSAFTQLVRRAVGAGAPENPPSPKNDVPRHAIVMSHAGEGWIDLYDYVEQYGPVPEDATRTIFGQTLASVLFLHELGVSHNDIKDENVLINPATLQVKLLDLGSATWLPRKGRLHPQHLRVPMLATHFYGTKKFASPECTQNQPYRTDMQEVWALGALLFVMLFKADPFRDDREICTVDISAKVARHASRGLCISRAAESALCALLRKDPQQRIPIQEIPRLEWFRG